MLNSFRSLFSSKQKAPERHPPVSAFPAPAPVFQLKSGASFEVLKNLEHENGLPTLNWEAARGWLEEGVEDAEWVTAWNALELAWLEHFRFALGAGYRLECKDEAAIVSTLDDTEIAATLNFISRTSRQIAPLLDGIAQVPEFGYDILLVLDDEETYYRYVSRYYREGGDYSKSGGMYISRGCGHFVTTKGELRAIEPTIAHEMTHSYLSHLDIPLWINEGIAVNTEQRLCPPPKGLFTPFEMQEKHELHWNSETIQQFWSGKSFDIAGDSNMLSYDLARILIENFSKNWIAFAAFVNAAKFQDGGAQAAIEHLGLDLGEVASSLMHRESALGWSPIQGQRESDDSNEVARDPDGATDTRETPEVIERNSRVLDVADRLGIPREMVESRPWVEYEEAELLEVAEIGEDRREHRLISEAARAWQDLQDAAEAEGITLIIVSAFRSVERQMEIVKKKLNSGTKPEDVLVVSALPGFSEHHTGRAVDVTTPGCPALDVAFAQTKAFQWLSLRAGEFGFFLSYPEGNPLGFQFEPWHWCFHKDRPFVPSDVPMEEL